MPPGERGAVPDERPEYKPGSVRVAFLAFGGNRYRDVPLDAVNGSPLAPFVKAGTDIIRKAGGGTGAR